MIAVIDRVLAAVVREIVPAVVTGAAAHIRADDHPFAHLQWNPFEIEGASVSSNGRNRSHVLVALNDRKPNLPRDSVSSVLTGIPLIGVLVRTANSRDLYFDQHAPGRRVGQRILSEFVPPGFDQGCREYAVGGHIQKSS